MTSANINRRHSRLASAADRNDIGPDSAGRNDIGPDSAGELERLRRRNEELENKVRRLEIENAGLAREAQAVRQPADDERR